jgi:hypothetical protein
MTKTYVQETAYYKQTCLKKVEILDSWKKNLKKSISGLDKRQRKKFSGSKTGDLPYGYILPKNKDINKCRPVVSYFNHPHKKLFNICSRAIMGMLKRIDKEHCILWKTGDLKKDLEEKIEKIVDDREDRKVCIKAYDIKQFYTNLNHKEIGKAWRWLLDCVKKKVRNCEFVSVCNNGKEPVRLGRKCGLYGWHDVDVNTIGRVIEMDLNNTFFTIGDITLQQTKGIPMGSPLSPVLAIMVCAYYENMFFKTCSTDERKRIEGIRYVDDIITIGGFEDNNLYDKSKTMKVMHEFESCYHEDLILEEEMIVENEFFTFLEGNIKIDDNNELIMKHKNINWANVRHYGKQKIKRFIHWSSFTSNRIKKSIVLGALNRILVHSSSEYWIIQSIMKLFFELYNLKYPFTFLRRIINTIRNKRKERESLWNKLDEIFQKVILFEQSLKAMP